MPEIIKLIDSDHRRIRRLLCAMNDAGQRPGESRHVAGLWGRAAELIMLHTAAEDEIWYPALYHDGQRFRGALSDCEAEHAEIREVLAEASLRPACSRQWWRAVVAATGMINAHLAGEQTLMDFFADDARDHASWARLGAQWHRFVGAWLRDTELTTSAPAAWVAPMEHLVTARPVPGHGGRDARQVVF